MTAAEKTTPPHLGRTIRILLVEDSRSDVAMIAAAFEEGHFSYDVQVVGDGEPALAFLRHEFPYDEARRPDVVILDLNLPRMDGRDVLRAVKSDDRLKAIPVVVLTTSSAEADISRCYELHANGYITKPLRFEGFVEIVRAMENLLRWVRLPTDEPE